MSTITRVAHFRQGRALHTVGELFTGTLEIDEHPPLGVPALDRGPRPVRARLSKGLSLPGSLPDVLGLAIKILNPDGDLDLLLSCLPGTRHYSTILSYRHDGGRVRFTAEPLGEQPPADPVRAHPPLAFALKANGRRIAILRLTGHAEGEADFDPIVNHHPALRPAGWVQRLRGRAYARSRLGRAGLPRASVLESARLGVGVLLPALAQGVALRRPLGVRLAALLDADRRGARLLERLRARHGEGPLLVRIPVRGPALIPLAAADVRRVLEDHAFTPANLEKRAALGHFQPHGVLITLDPGLRERRRRLNEQILEPGRPRHSLAGPFTAVIEEEVAALPSEGELTWPVFTAAHGRIARRLVLGDGARGDERLTLLLNRLRADANWFYLRRRHRQARAAFQRRLDVHLRRAEPGSLAPLLMAAHADPDVHAEGQAPHWLFAFDAAGIAAYRALALVAAHPGTEDLRAAVEESVRLWPTTLAVLRDTTEPIEWRGEILPEGTMVAIFSPYANRDPHAIDDPDAFVPGRTGWTGIPFSAGFARCPGRDLVLFTAETVLAALLRTRRVRPVTALPTPLPGTLDHFRLRFAVRPA
ncbi:cytochrome P450 [Nonomuraea sp. NPDC003804]|uniref:cytochrome P450 n=1 Tax=Nonomuraea sp. NPDC003804 TaxID=3154547 RepID=UPI0033BF40BB